MLKQARVDNEAAAEAFRVEKMIRSGGSNELRTQDLNDHNR